MFRTVSKTATAIALSLSIGLTAMTIAPTPARADAEDAAGVLLGLTALFLIGRAIEENNNRNSRSAATQPVTRHAPPVTLHTPRHSAVRVAPAQCFREFYTTGGQYARGYSARCMQNRVAQPGILPPECIRRVETNRGTRHIYRGRCLSRNGWQREAGFRP